MKTYLIAAALLGAASFANAQQAGNALPAYQPNRNEVLARYVAAQQLDSLARNTVLKGSVRPVWSPDGTACIYQNLLADSTVEFIRVDAVKASRTAAFDPALLAGLLEKQYGKKFDARKLPVRMSSYEAATNRIGFAYEKDRWFFDAAKGEISRNPQPPAFPDYRRGSGWTARSRWMSFETDSLSPDKKWIARIANNNILLLSKDGKEEKRLTIDGSDSLSYGSLSWSPDSKYLVAYKIHEVVDSNIYYVVKAKPNTTRGQLRSQHYKQPGDPFTTYEMYLVPIDGRAPVKVKTEIIDFFGAPTLHWKAKDPNKFLYEKVDRGHQRFRIMEVDATSGNTRTIYDEQTKTFIYESRLYTAYLPETNEIILSSEKEGWRQLYLLDAGSGQIKNKITTGEWLVREIDSIDTKKRQVWFRGSGEQSGEDPYHQHFYRIDFSGKNLVRLNPENGNHSVSLAPGGKYFIDTWSTVNTAPITVLRRTSDGKQVLELERADISRYLALQIPLAEPFHTKGRDGVTDIWGVVCRPTPFDPSKKYPVIENIYAGPQDAFVPKSFLGYGEMQSIAALGFVVVQIDGMGTANRSKAFHDLCWKNLADAGFADRILWIKALAEKYPWVDTSRVGLYGTSAGGQNALGGLLFHPEFYKAAVSACGCHDNRVDKQWWNEQWMGYPIGKHYEEQSNVTNAHRLHGELLLIVGDEDENVPPESTYRVADALIKSNKRFDFLCVPGMGHSDGGPYGRITKRDFFVRSFFQVLPPKRNADELNKSARLARNQD